MNLSSQPLVSVLTPVYNGEKYLAECIESVVSQTYQNIEYVIVNNCSTDRSLEVAGYYSRNDPRIRIHNNKEHLSLLKNLNHSLHQISPNSKYCKVVHADDWLFAECIEKMVNVAETNPTVGIVGSYRLEETKVTCNGVPHSSTIISGREICRSTLRGDLYIFGSPTTLLIRSDLIRARQHIYNENNLHADSEACYDLLRDSDFGFVHQVLSFTRRHNETETTFAKRLNTYILGNLVILGKYGATYLSNQEYELLLRKRLKAYYAFLGKSVFLQKEKEFWDYHKKGLKELGFPVNNMRLFKAACVAMFNKLLNVLKIQ